MLSYSVSIHEDEKKGIIVENELLQGYFIKEIEDIVQKRTRKCSPSKRLLGKTAGGNDFFKREIGNYTDTFVFGLDKLALSATPPDEKRYPTANAVKRFLMQGVRYIQLNSRLMKEPCPATRPTDLELDGSNLARVVGRLIRVSRNGEKESADLLTKWTEHVRYAIEDLAEIGWAKREPDNAEYLVLKYKNGFECPSWLVSDGTLRMLALTLLAFLPPPLPAFTWWRSRKTVCTQKRSNSSFAPFPPFPGRKCLSPPIHRLLFSRSGKTHSSASPGLPRGPSFRVGKIIPLSRIGTERLISRPSSPWESCDEGSVCPDRRR